MRCHSLLFRDIARYGVFAVLRDYPEVCLWEVSAHRYPRLHFHHVGSILTLWGPILISCVHPHFLSLSCLAATSNRLCCRRSCTGSRLRSAPSANRRYCRRVNLPFG